jgi:hypothetical protein
VTQALVTRVRDPAGVLYGALIAASVLAAASAKGVHGTAVALSAAVTIVAYWLAHCYIEAQSLSLAGDGRHVFQRIAHAASSEAGILQGGTPAIAVYLVAELLGATPETAATIGAWFSVAMLLVAGWLTARASGRHGWAAVVDTAVAGLFGIVVIVAKALLH